MTTNAGVGMSHHHNPNVVGHEAAEQALKNASITKTLSENRHVEQNVSAGELNHR